MRKLHGALAGTRHLPTSKGVSTGHVGTSEAGALRVAQVWLQTWGGGVVVQPATVSLDGQPQGSGQGEAPTMTDRREGR